MCGYAASSRQEEEEDCRKIFSVDKAADPLKRALSKPMLKQLSIKHKRQAASKIKTLTKSKNTIWKHRNSDRNISTVPRFSWPKTKRSPTAITVKKVSTE